MLWKLSFCVYQTTGVMRFFVLITKYICEIWPSRLNLHIRQKCNNISDPSLSLNIFALICKRHVNYEMVVCLDLYIQDIFEIKCIMYVGSLFSADDFLYISQVYNEFMSAASSITW